MTKRYEHSIGNTIDKVIENLEGKEPKGEFTVVVSGLKKKTIKNSTEELKSDLINLIKAGLSHPAASNYLSKKSGMPKREIYKLILKDEL